MKRGNEFTQPASAALSRRPGKRAQRGATLLEAIAFLGIAALVLVGAVALFSNAFQGARSNQLTEEVTAIENGVRKVYATGAGLQTNLAGGVSGLASAGVIPATLTVSPDGAAVTDEWGGPVTVTWDTTHTAAEITFENVPESVCIAAVTAGGDWSGISTANTTTFAAPPLPAATATTACKGTANTINWEFNS